MTYSNDSRRPHRAHRQLTAAALVVLASISWAQQVRAADPYGGAFTAAGKIGAGRVLVLAIDPDTPTTLYAGTECSGVLKSVDGGDSWSALNSGLTSTYVRALAIDPSTSTTLYAGTSVPYGGLPTATSGVFRSSNAGGNWQATGLTSADVHALAIDPSTPTTLYAGTGSGMFRSLNSGSDWSVINVGLWNKDVRALAIDPTTPATLYAGSYGEVFKSLNGGGNWRWFVPGLLDADVSVLVIDPATPTTVYAGTPSVNGVHGGVFRSVNGGSNWIAISTGLGDDSLIVHALAINPAAPSTLYAGTSPSNDSGGGVFRSVNRGETWSAVNTGLAGDALNVHALAIDPITPATLYAGTDAGVFRSRNGGGSWQATGMGSVTCGDGFAACNEQCDDGNLVDGDGCDSNCRPTGCGNGIVTAGEQCDPGYPYGNDGCSPTCTINPGWSCSGAPSVCTATCGDGIRAGSEQCDDGNSDNSDACKNDCTRYVCGDGVVYAAAEQCDDGNWFDGDGCDSNCTPTGCGNGIVSAREQCDDHNLAAGDGCDPHCNTEAGWTCPALGQPCQPVCGDGRRVYAEQCDDGNRIDGDGCDSNCTPTGCGNGIVTIGEECDDGNRSSFDGCTVYCTSCGNGIRTPPEECDDGNRIPDDGCTNACTRCGDGLLTWPETCDDGNRVAHDGCGPACTPDAQVPAFLVKDINAQPVVYWSEPHDFRTIGTTTFFVASTPETGTELWKTDGTAAGTVLVKDINPGAAGSDPSPNWIEGLTAVNGVLFFPANDGTTGQELWTSDGSAAGTRLVRDINPNGDSYPSALTELNGRVVFQASDGSSSALWSSDGTTAGTVLLKNNPEYYGQAEVDGMLFFVAGDPAGGAELWKTDGSVAGTVRVKAGLEISNPLLTEANGTLFFWARDERTGEELWKSDGTTAGTVLVKDINPGGASSSVWYCLASRAVDGHLFFTADNGTTGVGLWRSDGTAAGTVLVKSGVETPCPSSLTEVNGTLFFIVGGGELWKSDGTTAGTVLVRDLLPDAADLREFNGQLIFHAPAGEGAALWTSDGTTAGTVLLKDRSWTNFSEVEVDGVFFFAAEDADHGVELWKTDGTVAGTVLVRDINPGPSGSYPDRGAAANGELLFGADDGSSGKELWTSDGTTAGTVRVANLAPEGDPTYGSSPAALTDLNGTLFFTAWDGTTWGGLWKSDGSAAGTVLVRAPGRYSFGNLTKVSGTLFFTAGDSSTGVELWASDGTTAGTALLKSYAYVWALTAVDGVLFFIADDQQNGRNLWKTDGTVAGTVLVKEVNPGELTAANGTLFFTASDPASGWELWKSDGTAAGTALVRDINFGGSSYPRNLMEANGTLFFFADDGISGLELWKSDGTAAGTALVKDICAGDCGQCEGCGMFGCSCFPPQTAASVGGLLFFVLDGNQLWKSDGTDRGTVRVGDEGLIPLFPSSFTVVNQTFFFTARDDAGGVELWKSDGTAGGTGLVKDINPGPGDANPTALTNVNGRLVFQPCEPDSGCEMWRSDGTAEGTWQLDDIVQGAPSSNPTAFTRSGSLLYFTAEEALDGRELWAIPVSALEPPPCVGDCDGTGSVTIDELITLVNIALGNAQVLACPHGVPSGAHVDVALIIQAVNVALTGCAT